MSIGLGYRAGSAQDPLVRRDAHPAGRRAPPGSGARSAQNRSRRERRAMATDVRLKEQLPELTERILATYGECGRIHHLGHTPLPSYEAVIGILDDLREILYPGFGRRQNLHM